MTDPGMHQAVSAAPRWMRWGLVASLTANLLVAGIVIGDAFEPGGGKGPRGGVEDVGFGPFTEALSKEDRAALRDGFIARVPNIRAEWKESRAEFAALLTQLRAEPLDEAALRAAFMAQRKRMTDRLDVGQDLLIQRIAGMSPADRAAFADRLEKALRRPLKQLRDAADGAKGGGAAP